MQVSGSHSRSSLGRPLGNLEVFFKTLADQGKPLKREHWTIHLSMTLELPLSCPDPVPNLKCAWQVMRLQHPELGASITSEMNNNDSVSRPILVPTNIDLEAWTTNTFTILEAVSGDEVFSSLHDTAYPTCTWLPTSSQLIIISSHWRVDGVGMCLLGHHFMTALAATIGSELHPFTIAASLGANYQDTSKVELPKSLEELAPAFSRHPNLHREGDSPVLAAGADALVAEFLQGIPSIGLPTIAGSEAAIPSSSGRTARVLDADTTALISSSCRNMGFTVTSAVHAAIVRATTSFPQHPQAKSYAAFVPVDLRPMLGDSADQQIGLYFSGLPVCVESSLLHQGGESFNLIARKLGSVYSRDQARFWKSSDSSSDDDYLSLLDLVKPYVQRTTALFSTPAPEGFPLVQTPDLSSVGKIEKYIKTTYCSESDQEAVKVVDVWIGTEMLNRSIQFHVWSWMGALNLAASFNTSFYEKAFVVGVVDLVIEELLVGCGVKR
ncbi:hypothetical protein F5Y19DRAFT_120789 [Xylariaceae sp. FL1651]|nr:hypothetical protein F5Y19DRAFT_120789 [Xylariaceae sp. FL1651]